MIEPGSLNKRITIQERTLTQDGYGQELDDWISKGTVWANVKPIGGREKLRSGVVDSVLSHTIAIRYSARFMPPASADAWRIVYKGRFFNIKGARDVDEAHEFIIFDCEESSINGQ